MEDRETLLSRSYPSVLRKYTIEYVTLSISAFLNMPNQTARAEYLKEIPVIDMLLLIPLYSAISKYQ